MFRSKKQFEKALSLALSIAMLLCSLLALPALAHEHDVLFIDENGNEYGIMPLATCGCSNPNVGTYKYYHYDDPYNGCRVGVREFCSNCHWHTEVEAIGVGGCSSFSSLPNWPTSWDIYL